MSHVAERYCSENLIVLVLAGFVSVVMLMLIYTFAGSAYLIDKTSAWVRRLVRMTPAR